MAKNFSLEIITPTETCFAGEIWHVRAPGSDGEFGVLAEHAPMMAGLKAGRLRVDRDDVSVDYVIGRGFFEVHDSRAVVLTGSCTIKADIDIERAKAAQERALQNLHDAQSPRDAEEARAALELALAQIKIAEE